jgi:hypothetical protein
VTRFWISCAVVAVLAWPASGQRVEVEKPDRETIIHVHTALNHLTVLEMTEPVSAVAVGSPVFKVEWRENKVFIEPTEPDVATNLFVWTSAGRFNYELDPAGAVPQMVFAIDQPAPDPPRASASTNRSSEPTAPSPTDVLMAARPVHLLGPVPEKNRVAVYITDLLEHDGKVFIRYTIRNGTKRAYVPGTPQAVAVKAPWYRESLYTLKGSELGSNQASHVKSKGETTLEVVNDAIRSSRVEPGQETTGLVAIKLPRENTEPALIRLIFLASSKQPVSATLVL